MIFLLKCEQFLLKLFQTLPRQYSGKVGAKFAHQIDKQEIVGFTTFALRRDGQNVSSSDILGCVISGAILIQFIDRPGPLHPSSPFPTSVLQGNLHRPKIISLSFARAKLNVFESLRTEMSF